MENQNQPTLPTSPILNKSSNTLPEDSLDDVIIKIPDNIIGVIKLSESPDSIYHYFVASPMYAGFGNLNSPDRIYFLQDFSNMSPGLRNYLTSADNIEIIFSIGRGYDLEDSQISILGILIRELLVGKIFLKDFPISVSSRLGIDDIKAGEIVNKIISQSFGPIIEDVKRIQRSKFPDKIMAMQKESRPEGLSPKPQISEEVKNAPLNKLREDNQQITQSVRPPITQQIPPRPPLQMPPRPLDEARSEGAARPPEQPKPINIPQQSKTSSVPEANLSPRPSESGASTPQEKQFKMPDLEFLDSVQNKQPVPKNSISNTNQPPKQAGSPQSAQKSLEEELAKVANIIDLRSKEQGT
ncbi:MAG: hypothetical protein A3C61_02135 [Candidatus Yanofskybacteria bacterium RIFCSPHIGHO2_02_FULL_39_10]|uniref:Uncharacterized protein n=1 Tax=Candidatus Yanofskybacteria bacterium RIFCSPHIGHO2_02_FULL_39_10 TaxID=1802674 RepID=A0A1F8F633_9BACT|nr:MAG: hypothetical protein A3C61_02135 [Candidatus Yanofskybacteria bacterium RIFCSPHIGHO2_02_FULL_39_10]